MAKRQSLSAQVVLSGSETEPGMWLGAEHGACSSSQSPSAPPPTHALHLSKNPQKSKTLKSIFFFIKFIERISHQLNQMDKRDTIFIPVGVSQDDFDK